MTGRTTTTTTARLPVALALTAGIVAASGVVVTAEAPEPVEVLVRWDATSTPTERAALLAELGAERRRSFSSTQDVDVVVAVAGGAYDVEEHDHVVEGRAKVAERAAIRDWRAGLLAEAEARLAEAVDPVAVEDATKEVEEAAKKLREAEEDLAQEDAKLDEERSKHGLELVKELSSAEQVAWAEASLDGPVDDDRFHAWRFHAWPHGEAVPDPGAEIGIQADLATVHARATGAGVTIALLDTGAALGLPGVVGGLDLVDDDADPSDERDGVDDDGDGTPDEAYGHGTVVAGLVHQLAPGARILSYRVLDADGVGDPHAIALALEDAIDRGADVVNISAGVSRRYASKVVREAFKAAEAAGVVVVAAAGNAGVDEKRYPAAEKHVVAVAALADGDALASFSNRGKWVTLAAPGTAVGGVLPDGTRVTWSGTSFAAPVVAGQFALLRELAPDLDAKDLRKRVRERGREVRDGKQRAVDLLASLDD